MTYNGWYWVLIDWMSMPVMALVTGILVWRKLHREFPFFLWYVVVTEIGGVVRFGANLSSASTYFYSYWISDLVITIFNFLAVYELFARRLFPRSHRVRLYRYLFPMAASAIIIAGWLTALEAAINTAPVQDSAFLIESRVLSFVLAAMTAFFVALMLIMGRRWTRYNLGIAGGFALTSVTFLMMTTFWSRSEYYNSTFVQHLGVIGFDISCLIWLVAFWKPETETGLVPAGSLDPVVLHEARTWERTLKAWLTSGKRAR